MRTLRIAPFSLTQEAGYEVLELNGMPDHVHLLIKTKAQFDLSRLMKRIKGTTSALLNDSTDHQEAFRWQEGYCAITVTPNHIPRVRSYIQNQKQHHREETIHPLWENIGDEDILPIR